MFLPTQKGLDIENEVLQQHDLNALNIIFFKFSGIKLAGTLLIVINYIAKQQ